MNILVNEIDDSQYAKYWYLTYIAEIIKNIFFVVAFYIYAKQPRKSTGPPTVPYLDLI
jgi:hypothetical protein